MISVFVSRSRRSIESIWEVGCGATLLAQHHRRRERVLHAPPGLFFVRIG
jgi:hypothetical protein